MILAKYFTAARAKFDFLKSSTLGVTFVDKSWSDGFTRSVSLDYLMNFGKHGNLPVSLLEVLPETFGVIVHGLCVLHEKTTNIIFIFDTRKSEKILEKM